MAHRRLPPDSLARAVRRAARELHARSSGCYRLGPYVIHDPNDPLSVPIGNEWAPQCPAVALVPCGPGDNGAVEIYGHTDGPSRIAEWSQRLWDGLPAGVI